MGVAACVCIAWVWLQAGTGDQAARLRRVVVCYCASPPARVPAKVSQSFVTVVLDLRCRIPYMHSCYKQSNRLCYLHPGFCLPERVADTYTRAPWSFSVTAGIVSVCLCAGVRPHSGYMENPSVHEHRVADDARNTYAPHALCSYLFAGEVHYPVSNYFCQHISIIFTHGCGLFAHTLW